MKTPGGMQTFATVNESGLYSLLFAMQPKMARGVSDKHIAERQEKIKTFKRWVTHEVLPAIRRDGGYVAAGANDSDEVLMARALKAADAALKRKEAMLGAANEEIKALAPDAEYARTVLDADGTCTANIIAAQLGTTAIMLNRFLCEQRVTYRQGGVVLPCADARRRGLCKIHTIPYAYDENGNVKCSNQTKWTEAGRRYIVDLWRAKKGA